MNENLKDSQEEAKLIVATPVFKQFEQLYPFPARIIKIVAAAQDLLSLGKYEKCRDLWHAFCAGATALGNFTILTVAEARHTASIGWMEDLYAKGYRLIKMEETPHG